ncbi:uncharacterized protein LOC141714365 [Apium graveolens]|uniref:uncharacterized protein LOC141714365 n=1 Tax=Apium graveolens TaxID=4045 RepID=UPI003D79189E
MWRRRWLELIKDYDGIISYPPRKTNVVADALSRKGGLNVLNSYEELIKDFGKLEIEVRIPEIGREVIYAMTSQPEILEKIRRHQEQMMNHEKDKLSGKEIKTQKDNEGIYQVARVSKIFSVMELKHEILNEAHKSRLSIHHGSTKI